MTGAGPLEITEPIFVETASALYRVLGGNISEKYEVCTEYIAE
jgi:hypothetical protein